MSDIYRITSENMKSGIVKKLNYIFTAKQKVEFLFMLFIIFIGSCFELMGIAVIMPFVNAVMEPSQMRSNIIFVWVMNFLHISSDLQFIIYLGVGIVIIYLIKNLFLVFMYIKQYSFTYRNQRIVAMKLIECYVSQPYQYHLSKNISELQRNIETDVQMLFNAVLAALQLLSEIVTCSFLGVYLFFIDKSITIGIILMLGAFALFFLKAVRNIVYRYGEESHQNFAELNKWTRQTFEGIKEIKILNRKDYFINKIDSYYEKYATSNGKGSAFQLIPRPIFEAACICTMMIVVLIKIARGVNLDYFVPVLSAFVVAAYRMMPSFSRITSYLNGVIFNIAAIDNIYEDLSEVAMFNDCEMKKNKSEEETDFSFVPSNDIEVRDVSYMYPNSLEYVLENISVTIRKNSAVAFIGPTGSGKTTLVDIMLGLLEPQKGDIYIRGKKVRCLNESILGYIPQTIYLIDDTVRNNILFGSSADDVDDEKIWDALRVAQLADFIKSLDEGLDTIVGERGIRFSGGQRQRIGIARAIYNEPQILIFDEATSALDNETEKAVMEAVEKLKGSRTIIMIAHRLSTIKNCDHIYEVRDKKVSEIEKKKVFG